MKNKFFVSSILVLIFLISLFFLFSYKTLSINPEIKYPKYPPDLDLNLEKKGYSSTTCYGSPYDKIIAFSGKKNKKFKEVYYDSDYNLVGDRITRITLDEMINAETLKGHQLPSYFKIEKIEPKIQ